MSQFDATRHGSSCLNCVKIRRRLGLRPHHTGSSQRFLNPLPAFKGREGQGGKGGEGEKTGGKRREREGLWGRRGGKGKKGKGEGRDEERALPL